MEYEKEMERYQQEMSDALARWDARRYFNACNELGVEPSHPDLYEVGQLEISLQQALQTFDPMMEFIHFAKKLSPNDVSKNARQKRQLLVENFNRFRPGQVQDLSRYKNEWEVGSIFRKIYKHYDK